MIDDESYGEEYCQKCGSYYRGFITDCRCPKRSVEGALDKAIKDIECLSTLKKQNEKTSNLESASGERLEVEKPTPL